MITHYGDPRPHPARDWRQFAEGTQLLVCTPDGDAQILDSAYDVDGTLTLTTDLGEFDYPVDGTVTVREPRTTFAAIFASASA